MLTCYSPPHPDPGLGAAAVPLPRVQQGADSPQGSGGLLLPVPFPAAAGALILAALLHICAEVSNTPVLHTQVCLGSSSA